MKSSVLLLCSWFVISSLASSQTEPLPPPRQPAPRVVPMPPTPQGDRGADQLGKNTTIRLHGTTSTGQEIDLSMTGVGPRFNADQMLQGGDSTVSCEYVIKPTDQGFQVSYTVRLQIKMPVQPTQYRDVGIIGTVLCKPGEPMVILKNSDKSLQITVSQQAEEPKK